MMKFQCSSCRRIEEFPDIMPQGKCECNHCGKGIWFHFDNKKDDKINPSHYTSLSPQPIDVIESWELGYHLGTTVKYIARAGKKEGETALDDLLKARWYLDREIGVLEGLRKRMEKDNQKEL